MELKPTDLFLLALAGAGAASPLSALFSPGSVGGRAALGAGGTLESRLSWIFTRRARGGSAPALAGVSRLTPCAGERSCCCCCCFFFFDSFCRPSPRLLLPLLRFLSEGEG